MFYNLSARSLNLTTGFLVTKVPLVLNISVDNQEHALDFTLMH